MAKKTLTHDEFIAAWGEAKAARDAALAAADELPVEQRADARTAAREAWATAKADLLAREPKGE